MHLIGCLSLHEVRQSLLSENWNFSGRKLEVVVSIRVLRFLFLYTQRLSIVVGVDSVGYNVLFLSH